MLSRSEPRSHPLAGRGGMLLSQAIEGFILDCKARNLSSATIERAYLPVLEHLCAFLEDPPLSQIMLEDLRRFVVYLQESNRFEHGHHPWMEEVEDSPLSPFTIHRNVRVIKTFFRWVNAEGLLKKDPAKRLKYPEVPKQGRYEIFSVDEIALLLKAARKISYRNYALIFLLLDTGMRREEVVALTLDDVNLTSGQVTIRHGKGDKMRKVRMGNACRKALWRYVNEFRKPLHRDVQAFFIGRTGRPLTYAAIGSIFKRLSDKAGIKVFAHKFRHTFATMFAKKTPNAFLLADALGHSSLKMAKWYIHLAMGESTDNRISPMDDLLGDF